MKRYVRSSDNSDFVIDGKVLKKYVGKDTHVEIPEGIVIIDESAFQNCRKIEHVDFPDTLKWIRMNAFASCHSLQEVHLPEGLVGICFGAFTRCKELKVVELPSSLTRIEEYAFDSCTSLESINIPNVVLEKANIASNAFSHCPSADSNPSLSALKQRDKANQKYYRWVNSDSCDRACTTFAKEVARLLKSMNPDIHDIYTDASYSRNTAYWIVSFDEDGDDSVTLKLNLDEEQQLVFTHGPKEAAQQYVNKIKDQI